MQQPQFDNDGIQVSIDDINRVAPALARYTQEKLCGEVWNRPGLSKRDRSIVTLAALIARGQPWALKEHIDQALGNGLEPAEISEVITHLAFYSGWANALAAIEPTRDVFAERGVKEDQLPAATVDLLPLDQEAEAQRAGFVEATFGSVSPGIVEYTTAPLFREVWLGVPKVFLSWRVFSCLDFPSHGSARNAAAGTSSWTASSTISAPTASWPSSVTTT